MGQSRHRWLTLLAVGLMLVPSGIAGANLVAPTASAAGTPGTQYTLQGCRNNQTAPPYKSGTFICNDGLYTTGDLGKGWAELDLVPFRLTIQTGKTAPSGPVTRNLDVDYLFSNGVYGYDVLSVPVLNTAPDDGTGTGKARPVTNATCSFTVSPSGGAATTGSSPNGSAVNSLYRTISVNMGANQTCVFDFYARVALGAHNITPGKCEAKLHADLADDTNQIQGSGAKEVPIQICKINSQALTKSMTASQNQDFSWDVVTTPTNARITFGDTCGAAITLSQSNPVTVTWTKKPGNPSLITITTHVTVINPASRSLTVDVVDNVYAGTTLLKTLDSGAKVVKANSQPTTIDDSFTVPANTDTSNLNDLATATYTDTDTGQPISQTTTATASAPLQTVVTNNTAVITNTESIMSGPASAFRFSVDSSSGATGSFGSYTLGSQTAGPVTWTSDTQSASGSVTFNKTIYLVASVPVIASDTLQDSSNLTASNGFLTSDASNIDLDSDAVASLTINKSISFTPSSADGAQTFTFDVTDSSGNAVLVSDGKGNFVSPSVSVGVGQTSGSTIVPGLANGETYTIHEEQTPGYDAPPADQQVTVNIQPGNLASCGGYTVSFTNTIHASATVQKTTYPAGNEAGWTFTLYDPSNTAIGTATTTGSGPVGFVNGSGNPVALTVEGTYTVKETSSKSGWVNTVATSTFTVDFPAGGGATYNTTFTNTRCVTPTITAGNVNGVATFTITDPNSPSTGTGLIGGSLPALNPLALGTQVSSTGTNGVGIKVVKLTNAKMPAASWSDGAGNLVLSASKVNSSTGAAIGLVATALGGTPATVTVSSTGAVTVTNAGTCSNAFDPLLTSTIRQAGAPQTDTYTGIDKSESRLTVYNGQPGVGTMIVKVNGTTFAVGNVQDGQQKVLDIGSALQAGGDNTVSVTSTGRPGGDAVLLVAPPGATG